MTSHRSYPPVFAPRPRTVMSSIKRSRSALMAASMPGGLPSRAESWTPLDPAAAMAYLPATEISIALAATLGPDAPTEGGPTDASFERSGHIWSRTKPQSCIAVRS